MAQIIETDNGIVIIFHDGSGSAPGTSSPALGNPLVAADAPPLAGALAPVASAPTAGQGFALTERGEIPSTIAATGLRMLTADPVNAKTGEFWYRTDTDKLSVQTSGGVKRSAAFV